MVLTVGNCPSTENGREKIIFLTIRGQKRAFRGNNYLEKYCKRYNQFLTQYNREYLACMSQDSDV